MLSLTQLGPIWTGSRLTLVDPGRAGVTHPDVVGWSDFYSGCACDVKVARATDGSREAWLVWGGTLGVRVVPRGLAVEEAIALGQATAAPVLWVDALDAFSASVADVIAGRRLVRPEASGDDRRSPPRR